MIRKTLFLGLSLMLSCALMSVQCSKDDEELMHQVIMKDVESTAKSSNWQISYFMSAGEDKTENFSQLSLSFISDGTLEVSSIEEDTFKGAWAIDENIKETPVGKFNQIDFKVYFATPSKLRIFNHDWKITNYTSNKIELVAYQFDGQMDYLKLEQKEDL